MNPLEKKFKIWEIISRGFAPALITVAIAWATLFANSKFQDAELDRKKRETETQNALTQLQMSITRKDEETNIGLQIVENLMERFIEKGQGGANPQGKIAEKLFFLRLTALNFQDVALNLKPFFEQIDEDLNCVVSKQALEKIIKKKELPDPLSEADLCVLNKQNLRGVGKELARRQAFLLSFTGGFLSDPIEVTAVDPHPKIVEGVYVASNEVKIKAEKIQEDSIQATIIIGEVKIGPLTVSYFDAPLVDNVRHYGFRWSVLLEEVHPKAKPARAQVRLLQFRPHLAPDRIELLDQSRGGFRPEDEPERE